MGSGLSPLGCVGAGSCGRFGQDQDLLPAPLSLVWLKVVSTISSHRLSTVFEHPPRGRSPPGFWRGFLDTAV